MIKGKREEMDLNWVVFNGINEYKACTFLFDFIV